MINDLKQSQIFLQNILTFRNAFSLMQYLKGCIFAAKNGINLTA